MYIAMNRFKINPEACNRFEQIWLTRETQLHQLPGFVEFHLLKGPVFEDYVLYASHTIWRNKEDFENWTKSEAFRVAHANAGQPRQENVFLEAPVFEGFEILQTIEAQPLSAMA